MLFYIRNLKASIDLAYVVAGVVLKPNFCRGSDVCVGVIYSC